MFAGMSWGISEVKYPGFGGYFINDGNFSWQMFGVIVWGNCPQWVSIPMQHYKSVCVTVMASWCCGRASDSRSRGRGFESRPRTAA